MACTANRIPARICPEHGVCHGCGGMAETEHQTARGPMPMCSVCVPQPLVPTTVKVHVVTRISGDGPCTTCGCRRYWRGVSRYTRAGGKTVPADTYRICADCYSPLPGRKVEEIPEA